MQIGDFRVTILEGINRPDGYVEMSHGQKYTISLHNSANKRAAADIWIDGKNIGTFRLNSSQTLTLEHPSKDNGQFTFYKDGTREALAAELDKVSKSDRGLIMVIFKPEKITEDIEYELEYPLYPVYGSYIQYPTYNSVQDKSKESEIRSFGITNMSSFSQQSKLDVSKDFGSGGTGLSGSSNQKFKSVPKLNYDQDAFVTISLRLISSGIKPLRANPVPVPIN